MKTVQNILDQKGGVVHTVDASKTVLEAIGELARKGIGALVVLKEGKPVGLFSERDYTCKVILTGKRSENTPVGDVMTRELVVVGPDTQVDECMALMTEKRIRHLPVLDHGELIGLVSIGDIVKDIISEQQVVIEQLERYVYYS
ncbi:CBS domain-containing protein [Thiolapillus brandeum]|uniref:Signal transduction protein n=1 Tax=Thiolapillus brandeum TaxID=1076588 RepID=A0A7U6GJ16_9GAMM|nr:CBS domain-containing protein [Thiolapillus brandeum]BAO44519.1 signal transduction protein [Thiolapillus brandeum]